MYFTIWRWWRQKWKEKENRKNNPAGRDITLVGQSDDPKNTLPRSFKVISDSERINIKYTSRTFWNTPLQQRLERKKMAAWIFFFSFYFGPTSTFPFFLFTHSRKCCHHGRRLSSLKPLLQWLGSPLLFLFLFARQLSRDPPKDTPRWTSIPRLTHLKVHTLVRGALLRDAKSK